MTHPQQPPSCLHTWTVQVAYVTVGLCQCSFWLNFKVFTNFRIYGVLPGRLTKADRELIVVATSIHNKCLYCVVSHSALHRIYSKKPSLADQVMCFSNFTFCVSLWLPLTLNYRSCDLPHAATRSSLTIIMPTCHPGSMQCWTLRWQYAVATPSRSSISRLWRNMALTVKTPGTSPPLLLSSPCPIGLHTSPIWDQMRSFITWAAYQGTRAQMVDQWKMTSDLILLMLAARFVIAVINGWDLN